MQYVHTSLIANVAKHSKLGCAFVAGISLCPITSGGLEWLHAIGAKPELLTADEASNRLSSIVLTEREAVTESNARLESA